MWGSSQNLAQTDKQAKNTYVDTTGCKDVEMKL